MADPASQGKGDHDPARSIRILACSLFALVVVVGLHVLSTEASAQTCYPDPFTGQQNCPSVAAPNCVVYSPTTGQYVNTLTGRVYGSYNQCVSSSGVAAPNCVVYNQATGQYVNTLTGQVYGSYNQCVSSSGVAAPNCVVYNPTTGQYVNTLTGQVYGSYNQCVSSSGVAPATCVFYNQDAGLYVNSVTGVVYDTYSQCLSSTGVGQLTPPYVPPMATPLPYFPPPYIPPYIPPAAIPATQVPAPVVLPTPTPAIVPVPAVAPPATTAPWLHVLSATQAYSVTMDPLWVAQPGEWYYVVSEEDGWALAVWENDPPDWQEWIQMDTNVELVMANRSIPESPV